MGLDIAEFVMDVEDEFDIEIPDDLQKISTVGDFVDWLCKHLNERKPAVDGMSWSRESVRPRVIRVVAKHTPVPADRISDEMRFVQDLELD
ncbi:MAG TPA: hypothetical protein PK280_06945 [Planctomycetota bacterium]|nr:hypothetical protein [Planctomycetota bacterium]